MAVKVGAVALGFHVWGIDFIWVVLGFTFCYDILRGIFSCLVSLVALTGFSISYSLTSSKFYRYDKVHFIIRSDYHGHAGAGSQGNQVIIGIGAGASRKRYVVYKVEHTARGYVYHMVDTETKEISQTDILRPLSQTFGIGRYYDDVNPEFMDAFEVALLVRQAEEQATAQAIAAAKEKAEHDRIAEIGAQRLRRIMPEGVQGVIIAELNETEYTDPSYECSTTRSVRTVILGFRPPLATASGS